MDLIPFAFDSYVITLQYDRGVQEFCVSNKTKSQKSPYKGLFSILTVLEEAVIRGGLHASVILKRAEYTICLVCL